MAGPFRSQEGISTTRGLASEIWLCIARQVSRLPIFPDQFEVDLELVVSKDIPEAGDLLPRRIR